MHSSLLWFFCGLLILMSESLNRYNASWQKRDLQRKQNSMQTKELPPSLCLHEEIQQPYKNKHTAHLSQDFCIWVVGQYWHTREAGTEYEVPWLDLTGVQSSQGRALMFSIHVRARVSPQLPSHWWKQVLGGDHDITLIPPLNKGVM